LSRQIDQVEGNGQGLSLRRLVSSAFQTTTFLGLAALILANVTVVVYLDRQEKKEIQAAHVNASNLTTAFEQHIVRAIKNIDQALLVARAEFERDPASFSVETVSARNYFPNDLAIQLAMIGPDGWVRGSNLQASGAVNLNDREHFRVHADFPQDELFIFKPVLGRVSKVWTIQFTRKLLQADGTFAGVLVASVDPRLLSRFYDSIDIGQSGAITLWGTDYVVRARSGMGADALGQVLPTESVRRVLNGETSGRYETFSVVDGVDRIVSFRKIEDYPLIVSVGLGRDEILSGYHRSKIALERLMFLLDAALVIIMALGTAEKYRLSTMRERLSSKATMLASTLANMQEGILMVDAQGHVLTINDRALALLGVERAQLDLSVSYSSLPLLRYEEKVGGPLLERLEVEYRPNCILEVRTSPLSGGGFVKTLSDITARRRDQDLLLDARDRAETASRARTSFLATMSHEIRTPLSGIVSMADLIAATPLDPVQQRYIEITRDSAEHLLALLSDVLDVTKLDADQVSLESIRFDFFQTLRGALDILSPKAIEKGLSVGCYLAPDVPREVMGDPGRLRQVLINLLGNAIKFTQAGHVLLEVTRLRDEAGDKLLISVEDTGIGIAKENLQHLFHDFSQIESSITRRFGGTGLGLAISRKLVARMGGTIGVRSEPGKGSTFFFEIPLKDFSEPSIAPCEALALAIAAEHDFDRNVIERQLSPAFAHVAAFKTLADAEAWLQQASDPRKILLAEMPIIPRGTKSFAPKGTEAFLLCARQDFLAQEHAIDLACAGLLQKPVFLDDVREALSHAPAPSRKENMRSPLAGELDALHVLLAEDNATNQFALRRMLENMGAQVVTANNGCEAVEQAQLAHFDVILMDVMMPELDGLAAARAIRSSQALNHSTPMIALTASAFAEDREAAYDAGMDGFATKPITARGLLKAINSCLKGRPMRKSTEDSGREEMDRQLPALDRKLLDQMAEDLGPQYLAQALEVFFKDLEQRRQALRDLGDHADQLRKAAHAIKGSAASFGFVRVAHAAQALEQAARLGEHQHFEALKNDLLREAEVAPEHMNLA
jgi:signal transduction histidine kinase/CheY-like chemotaxis protein